MTWKFEWSDTLLFGLILALTGFLIEDIQLGLAGLFSFQLWTIHKTLKWSNDLTNEVREK